MAKVELRGFAKFQHQHGKGVPGVVETDRRQSCPRYHRVKRPEKISRINRLPIGLVKDQPMILIRLSQQQLLFGPSGLMLFQSC